MCRIIFVHPLVTLRQGEGGGAVGVGPLTLSNRVLVRKLSPKADGGGGSYWL